ncbi:MAG: hypothetical protein KME60_29935 [Cyanomargarita calcarea GSE-NOS-MK-12-04C]|jgi:hypothetical protein|uniref:Uncharacterized protein n=1 Tax=Cyanomargarita calcarea GSE-NOS-MK-12-04C TaxID=2839659 RepID=A0A951UVB8_9CYAN|nr:hypothetical protein [Cyanomargarita calcarea GSE-NOS-MK-12-04C]
MTTTQTDSKKQEHKSSKKKQSFPPVSIGTPRVPVQQHKTNHEYELLSDWDHAS